MKIREVYFYTLGALIVIGFFVVLILLMVLNKNQESINLVIGALLGAFGSVVGYFFGSSKGSADKNEMVYNSTPKEIK